MSAHGFTSWTEVVVFLVLYMAMVALVAGLCEAITRKWGRRR